MPILRVPDGKGGYSEIPALVGPAGKDGKDGAQGLQGVKGDKGDKGDPGLKGDQGVKGDTGDRGPQGIQGFQGVPGRDADPVVIIGPGRPDYAASTQGLINGGEPIGSEYRCNDRYDLSILGARGWIYDGMKWRIIDGDTGWFDVTPSTMRSANGPGTVAIRRVVNTVTLRFSPTYPTGGSVPGGKIMDGFAGFEPSTTPVTSDTVTSYTTAPLANTAMAMPPNRSLVYVRTGNTRGGLYSAGGTGALSGTFYATLTWQTDEDWPITRPYAS